MLRGRPEETMKTIKGPGLFLAQFAQDSAPHNTLENIARWAKNYDYQGIQIPTWDKRLFDLDKMGIDIQVVAPAPGQCYYSIDPKIAESAHRLANDGVVEYCSRKPDRFVGLGTVPFQAPEAFARAGTEG